MGRARRERILDRAVELFGQLGYHRVSLATIAKDVGITTPGLMHHFPTKQHLLVAVADRRFNLLQHWAEDVVPDVDGTGVLRNMLRLSRLAHAQPGLIELFVVVAGEAADIGSATHALYKDRYERVIAQLTADFRTGVERGFLRDDVEYEDVARECIAVIDGLQLQWVLSEGRLDLVGRLRDHLERLAPTITRAGAPVQLDRAPSSYAHIDERSSSGAR